MSYRGIGYAAAYADTLRSMGRPRVVTANRTGGA